MDFSLPDLEWWIWALAATGGAFLAFFFGKLSEDNRLIGALALVSAVAATACGVLAISGWITSH